MSRRNPFAARSDASTRAKARALSAERPPVVSTPEQRASAFEGLDDGPLPGYGDFEPCEAAKPLAKPAERLSIHFVAVTVAAQLTREGRPGSFTVETHRFTAQVTWHGDAVDRGAAEETLVKALVGAGYEADAPLCYGVRVTLPAEPPSSAAASAVSQVRPGGFPLRPYQQEVADRIPAAPLVVTKSGIIVDDPTSPLPPIGSPDAPAWTRKPVVQHAASTGNDDPCGATVGRYGDEPTEGERAAYDRAPPSAPIPALKACQRCGTGFAGASDLCGKCSEERAANQAYNAARLTSHPVVQHANACRLTSDAIGPVKYEDMDPGELPRSFRGRMARRFGEV